MSGIAWATVRDALHDYFKAATALGTVRWRDQVAPQPAYPFGTLKVIAGPTGLGQDEVRTTFDAGAMAGSEMAHEVAGQREMTVSFQVLTSRARGAAFNAEMTAGSLMAAAQTALEKPSVLASLRAAGLAVIERGSIQDLAFVAEGSWVDRVQMDVRFGLASNVLDTPTGYIATVGVSSDLEGVSDVDVELVDEPLGE